MSKVLFALLIAFFAVTADAACIKCDQTTGWWCYMSIFGTKANCDSPSGAGCFMWGSCGAAECEEFCEENPVALRFTERMPVASATVVVSLHRS